MEAWLSNPPLMGDAFGQPGTGHITRCAGGVVLRPPGSALGMAAVTRLGPTTEELLAEPWLRGQLHLTMSVRHVGQTAGMLQAGSGGTSGRPDPVSIGREGDDTVS